MPASPDHIPMTIAAKGTATMEPGTDTIIQFQVAELEALRVQRWPLARRIMVGMLIVALLVSLGLNLYQYTSNQHLAPVQTDGWMYADSSQVIYLFNFPGVGGDSTVQAVIFISYHNPVRHLVVEDNQKVHVTIYQSTLTFIADGSTLAGHGVYQDKRLTVDIGPHDNIPIWAAYVFQPASESDHTAALQNL